MSDPGRVAAGSTPRRNAERAPVGRNSPGDGGAADRVGPLPRPTARTFAAVVLLAVNMRTLFASLPPLLSHVRAELGLSATVAGLLTTLPVLLLGMLATSVPRLVRRISIERVLVACAALTALGCALRGLGSVAALFAGTIVAGAAIAVAQTAVPVLIRSRYSGHAGPLTGAFSMALTLGAAIAAGLAIPFEHLLHSSADASLAIWALPALFAAIWWLPAALGTGTVVPRAHAPPLPRDATAWAVSAYFGVQSMAFYAGLAWLPSILESARFGAGQAGALQSLSNAVQVAPAFLVPVLAHRSRRQGGLLVVIVAFAVAGVAGLLAAPRVAVLWVVLLGVGQGGSLGLGLILPLIRGRDVQTVASLTAMMLCIGYVIAAAGPWLLGLVRDTTGGWSAPLAVLLAITAGQLVPGFAATRDRTVGRETVEAR